MYIILYSYNTSLDYWFSYTFIFISLYIFIFKFFFLHMYRIYSNLAWFPYLEFGKIHHEFKYCPAANDGGWSDQNKRRWFEVRICCEVPLEWCKRENYAWQECRSSQYGSLTHGIRCRHQRHQIWTTSDRNFMLPSGNNLVQFQSHYIHFMYPLTTSDE